MPKYLLGLSVGVCLVLLVKVEAQAADPDTVKDLDTLSRDATAKKWEDLVKDTAPMTRKYDPEETMHLMSNRNPSNNKGGVGIGSKPGAIAPDGIESKLKNMAAKGIPQNEMAQAADFKKMADQIAAIGAATHGQKHEKKAADPGGAMWKKTSQDMYEQSKELAKAIDEKNQNKISTAAKTLDGTCTTCHKVYRP